LEVGCVEDGADTITSEKVLSWLPGCISTRINRKEKGNTTETSFLPAVKLSTHPAFAIRGGKT
jgi:hypothetical protein